MEEGDRRKPKNGYFDIPKDWVSIATLIFVAGYTIITAFIWCTQRDQERRQLRAYISAKTVSISADPISSPQIYYIDILWENTGNTPGQHLALFNGLLKPDATPPSVPVISRIFLAPHAQTDAGRISVSAEELSDGNRYLLYWAVTYDDVFGSARRTQQAWQFRSISQSELAMIKPGQPIGITLTPSPRYTCMDDECPKQ